MPRNKKLKPEPTLLDDAGVCRALTAAGMGAWYLDVATNTHTFDGLACTLLGIGGEPYSVQEKEFFTLVHPDDRKALKAALVETIEHNTPYTPEYRVVWPDGSVHDIAARGGLVSGADKSVRLTGIVVDITERKSTEYGLKESAASLQAVLQSTADGILAVDAHGKVLFANSGFATLWKIPKPVLESGDDSRLLKHVLDQLVEPQAFLEKVQQLYKSDKESFDTLFFKDGRIFERLSRPLWSGKKLDGRVWSFHDVSELKSAEMALVKSNQLLKEAQEIANMGSYVLNIPANRYTSSEMLDTLFGISKEDLHTIESWLQIVHPDDRLMMTNYFMNEVVGMAKPFNKSYRILRKNDKTVRWVHGLGQLILDSRGRAIEMHGTIQDITESMLAQMELDRARIAATNVLQDLQQEKKKLDAAVAKDEAIISAIGDGLVATDTEGRIVLTNAMFEKMTGWEKSEVHGRLLADIIPITDDRGERIPEGERLIANRLTEKGSQSGRTDVSHFFVRKNGTRFHAALTVTPVLLDGQVIGAVEVFRDITKEKTLDRAKTEFISVASHQLRTPVAALRWITEALKRDAQGLGPKQQQYLNDLTAATDRLAEMVEGLLDVSRIQMKSAMLAVKENVVIPTDIESFVHTMDPFAELKRHTLVFRNEISEPVSVTVNRKSLNIVLQNLISNAVDYSPEHTIVTITVEKTRSHFKISVHNGGEAISDEDKPRLFERFYRGVWARKVKVAGTGLGLYISRLLVDEMGGTLGFESEPDTGTTFWFTIHAS